MIRTVNFYKNQELDEIHTLCKRCKIGLERGLNFNLKLEYIDKAGDWDICEDCEAQNVPKFYVHPPADFPSKTTT